MIGHRPEVGSIYDVICYTAEQSGEAQPWIDRAVSNVIDLFKARNGVVRFCFVFLF